MVEIKIVPKALWEQMREYLYNGSAILVPEDAMNKLPADTQKFIREQGVLEGYNFGGDADVWLDIITSPDSNAATDIMKKLQAGM